MFLILLFHTCKWHWKIWFRYLRLYKFASLKREETNTSLIKQCVKARYSRNFHLELTLLGCFALFRMFNLSWQKNCTMDIGNHFKPVIYFQASDVAQERILLMSKCFWFWPIFWKLLYLELQKATINRSEPTTNPELDFYEIQNLST